MRPRRRPERGEHFTKANQRESVMAKEQKRGTREAKKPKQEKPKVIAAAPRRVGQVSTEAGKK